MSGADRLGQIAENLETERRELWSILTGMLKHKAETHQLDSALKCIDTASGLIRAVEAAKRAAEEA